MVKIVQNSFLGGQLDFEMMGRQDVDKYAKGATTLKNFILLKRGAISKRHGTNFLHDVSAQIGNSKYRLVPFAYTLDEGWALLFTAGKILAISATKTVHVRALNADYYTSEQLETLDYEQCGDVLYIAQQSHPPCKIEHYYDSNTKEHSFILKKIDLNLQNEGIPSIVGAYVSKTGITTKGPKITETYKVTAVFDGVETFPSEAYSNSNCADYDEGYTQWQKYLERCDSSDQICSREYQPSLKTYSGTSYTQPWTQSQKISLDIAPATRVASDGVSVIYPEQIRIYRKTGSFFGLVGFIDTKSMNGSDTATATSGVTAKYQGDSKKGNEIADNVSCGAYGWGIDGFLITGELKLTLPINCTKATVNIVPGSIVAHDESETYNDDGEIKTRIASTVYTFRPCLASKFYIRLGAGVRKSVSLKTSLDTKEFKVARGSSEGLEDFRMRASTEFNGWVTQLEDSLSVAVEVSSTGPTTTLLLSADVMSYVVSNVHVKSYAEQPEKMTWDDKFFTPDVSQTPPTAQLFMNEVGEYPACVCLSQQRLIWASTLKEPARVIMSQIGNFDTYAPHDAMVADDPIDFQISATRFPKVNHIVELRKLLMFNGDSEWVVDSASTASGITFETIQARQHSAIGAANWLKPIVCNNVLLFAERTGQAVRQYGYQLEDDGFGGEDISIFSASIFRDKRIVSWVYQQHPHSTCWCVLSDGTICSLTFMREQQTIAWATHEFGGGGKAKAVVCSHALVGRTGGLADTSQVFVLVERSGVWSIEELRPECAHGGDTLKNALCLDSMRILGYEDSIRPGAVVFDPTTGLRNTQSAAGLIEGFTFESEFTSVYPVIKDDIGMAQMDVKCINGIHLRMSDAVGGEVRAIDVPASEASKLERTVKTLVPGASGEVRVTFPKIVDETPPLVTSNNRDGRVTITQSDPWPFTLLMLETDIECEQDERNGR